MANSFSIRPRTSPPPCWADSITYLPEPEFSPHLEEGRLTRVLEDWCPPFSGYHLYYPSRRQPSPAFALVLEALRYRD
ncbi:MAG TPA: LysR substrate-binding domain-containing protein [Rhodanobacteraceae bacterium]|nr:LysR substrate-binding domain-containing protein [Rhodanobacteraceae bacterium]